jgi:regulator of RNase E activity RraA
VTSPPETILSSFEQLDSAAVSDALDALGLPPGQGGFLPVWGHPKTVGFAVTVQLEPRTPGPAGPHIGTGAVATATPEDVIVVANDGRTDVSCWGGLLSLGASLKGVRGVVADGACRDVGEARELGFPVFSRGRIPATARGRLQQRSTGEPVRLGQVTVHPGDLVFADETGVAVVPRAHLEDVLEKAQGVAGRERAIAADLQAGIPLHEAMHDARLAGTTKEH